MKTKETTELKIFKIETLISSDRIVEAYELKMAEDKGKSWKDEKVGYEYLNIGSYLWLRVVDIIN